MTRSVKVGFAAPREVAFDFLVDPHNRMQWQSGLRAVEDVQPMPPQVGPRDSPNFARLDQTRRRVGARPGRLRALVWQSGITV